MKFLTTAFCKANLPWLFCILCPRRTLGLFPIQDAAIALLWIFCTATTAQCFCFHFGMVKILPWKVPQTLWTTSFAAVRVKPWGNLAHLFGHFCINTLFQNSISMSICLFYKILKSSKRKCFGTITQRYMSLVYFPSFPCTFHAKPMHSILDVIFAIYLSTISFFPYWDFDVIQPPLVREIFNWSQSSSFV